MGSARITVRLVAAVPPPVPPLHDDLSLTRHHTMNHRYRCLWQQRAAPFCTDWGGYKLPDEAIDVTVVGSASEGR